MVIDTLRNYLKKRQVQDLLFWVVSYAILLTFFTQTNRIRTIDHIYTFLFHLPLFFAVSLNSYHLIPKMLSKGHFGLFLLLHLPLYGLSYAFYYFTFNRLAGWVFPDFYFIANYGYADFFLFYLVYIGLTTLLELSKGWFEKLEIEKKIEALKKEKVETELKVLREQINPHFLFNSLNHIYALATCKSPKTPQAVLQLSELLRYTLKQSDSEAAPLEDEIDYIDKYISLYKDRVHHPDRVRFTAEGEFSDWSIAPLLLIFFIENCFKHGTIEQPGETIFIRISLDDGRLTLQTSNTVDSGRELPQQTEGFGLDNVERRLELRYPGRHQLDIVRDNQLFEVTLTIELDE